MEKFNNTLILIIFAAVGVFLQRIFFFLLIIPIGVLAFILLILGVNERLVEIIFWTGTSIVFLPLLILAVLDLLIQFSKIINKK